MKKVLLATLIAVTYVVGSSCLAMATHVDLLPGSTVSAAAEAIPGSSLVTSLVCNFVGKNAQNITKYTGTLYQEVRRDGSDGDLIFVYWVKNNSGSTDALSRITTTDYSNFFTEVAYVSGTGTPLSDFTRSIISGSVVGFNFSSATGLPHGATSAKMWIKVNSPYYTIGSTQMLNGAISDCQTYAPSAIPEPTSMVMLGMGLFGAGVKLRRKFTA